LPPECGNIQGQQQVRMLPHVVVHLLLFIFVLTIIILVLTSQANCVSEFFITVIVRLALFVGMILVI